MLKAACRQILETCLNWWMRQVRFNPHGHSCISIPATSKSIHSIELLLGKGLVMSFVGGSTQGQLARHKLGTTIFMRHFHLCDLCFAKTNLGNARFRSRNLGGSWPLNGTVAQIFQHLGFGSAQAVFVGKSLGLSKAHIITFQLSCRMIQLGCFLNHA